VGPEFNPRTARHLNKIRKYLLQKNREVFAIIAITSSLKKFSKKRKVRGLDLERKLSKV
jgi:hypothetical protein